MDDTIDHRELPPRYDATKPIVCTIEAADIADHIDVLERLRSSANSIERTQHGVAIQLPASSAHAADARRFAAVEQRCCEFWGFDVTETPDIVIRWDGPPETSGFMDRLVGYFEGREPIGTLFGSL